MPTFTSVYTASFNTEADNTLPANHTTLDGVNGEVRVIAATQNFHNPFAAHSAARHTGTYTDDQYAEVTVSGLSSSNNADEIGVVVRAGTGVDTARTFYYAYIKDTTVPTLTYGKVVTGTTTAFTTDSTVTTWANGDKLLIYVQGTTIGVKKNRGADLLSTTDSAISTGKPGIMAFLGADVFRGDDIDYGNVTAATGGGPLLGGLTYSVLTEGRLAA